MTSPQSKRQFPSTSSSASSVLTLVDVEAQKTYEPAVQENIALPYLPETIETNKESISADDTSKTSATDNATIIDWAQDDPEHPLNWSPARKNMTVAASVCTALIAAINVTSIALLNPIGTSYFGVSSDSFTLGITVNMVAIAIAPLFLAPLSEVVGRNVIFQVTSVITMLLFIPQATSSSFVAWLVVRALQGVASSCGNSMVGGVVADVYSAEHRGQGMNILGLVVFLGQSLGGAIFGWVGPAVGLRWSYGIMAFCAGFSCLLNACFLRETRSDVLIARRAARMTKATGQLHIARSSMNRPEIATLIRMSLARPVQFLCTEPIVTAMSMWVGFAWACMFLGGTSITLVFAERGWTSGQLGSVQMVIFVGAILGFLSNYHQQHLYTRIAKRDGGKAPPEARLIWATVGSLLFSVGMYVFAWTGNPNIHWIVPVIALCIVNWGTFAIYCGVFNYIADAYETYSSSAQASQSLVRNMFGAVFPLFARRMYVGLGYAPASTVVASIGLVLTLAPLLLMKYGKVLREKSKVASSISEKE